MYQGRKDKMGLISDLQKDILDPKTSLTTILRKAKVLASTLWDH
jgi:hypothetical protein